MSTDSRSLLRALALEAERLPTGGWLVAGRYVDPLHGCGCPDRLIRGATCKHELAARLDVLDDEIRDALRHLVTTEPAGAA